MPIGRYGLAWWGAVAFVALGALVTACADDGSNAERLSTTSGGGPAPTLAAAPTTSAGPDPALSTTVPAIVEPPSFPPATPLSADTMGLSATLDQYREDVAEERIRIRIENSSAVMVRVETLQLAWPGLTPMPPEPVGFNVQPRMKVGLLTTYGTAVCSEPAQVPESVPDLPIAATVESSAGTITFPVTDPLDVLRRLYEPSCERQAIDAAATIEFGKSWVDAGTNPPRLDGTLVLTRNRSDAAVTVTGLSGSVLLLFTSDALPATMTPDQDRLEIPVSMTNGRCDGHALGESKQTYLFQMGVQIDGADASRLLVPEPALQERFFDGIIAKCPPEQVGD